MKFPELRKYSRPAQCAISIALVLAVSGLCYLFSDILGYRTVALVLLMTVSLVALVLDILPVMLTALLSALIWNFFFIEPRYTLHIDNTEDVLLFLFYFIITLLHAVLTFKIRDAEKKARDKDEKEHTIRLYNTLLNSLSHELRTPVATILGTVDTLRENKEKLSETQQNELLTQLDSASIRLNRQVENLLNMSRLESGTLQLKRDWCDVNELIHKVIASVDSSAGSHKIIFEADETLPLFRIDAGLIEQVLQNIIHNALLYTPKHSTVKIEAVADLDFCSINITDNGPGFPKQELERVFDKFYRLPDTGSGGSGLGLSIARGFTEAHQGSIHLENLEQGGAKFTIRIPCETSFINNLKNE